MCLAVDSFYRIPECSIEVSKSSHPAACLEKHCNAMHVNQPTCYLIERGSTWRAVIAEAEDARVLGYYTCRIRTTQTRMADMNEILHSIERARLRHFSLLSTNLAT